MCMHDYKLHLAEDDTATYLRCLKIQSCEHDIYTAVLIDKNTALLHCLNKTICQLTVKVVVQGT